MATSEILTTYIQKLNHPLKEIRERSLQLLLAKLQLGWELDDELSETRQLLEALLSWFCFHKPSLQKEALHLLLVTIKTKAGTYIAKEFGVKTILSNLNKVKEKIDSDALEVYEDVVETLRFLNTVTSEENVTVPRLLLPEVASSESDGGSSKGYYNLGPNFQSSKETSVSNDDFDLNKNNSNKLEDGVRILLFPWVDLSPSDLKTMLLVEDALRLLKSTRRCCRFIRDVFLRDFPAETFLNRPQIIKSLLSILDGNSGGRPGEALQVLLCITRALQSRLLQLCSLDLVHETSKDSHEHTEIDDGVDSELERMAGTGDIVSFREEDGLAALKQLPAPMYALDTLYTVLSIMSRGVVLIDPAAKCEILNLRELNMCLCLVESLLQLLLDCVSDNFWCMDHNSKTYRDISHKSCMVMRLLGDLLMKYRKSFFEDTDRTHHRMMWLRLVSCGERLLNWARGSALPPSSLAAGLQTAQLDPAIELFYPQLGERIAKVLQNTKTSVDHEYKTKYRELAKLFLSMEDAVLFMKNKNSCRSSKKVLLCIKNSLPIVELIQSESLLKDISDILFKKTKDFDMNDSDWSAARSVALKLMAHNVEWVRVRFYGMMSEMVQLALVGDETHQLENEKCLTLLCDVGILTEICCHGLSSPLKEVEESASEIMVYLLRGRLVLSESCWWRLLASLLPILPLLHVYAAHETQLGQAICKSLERGIAECMGVSAADVMSGLVRLLFVRCIAVQLDAAHSLCRLLDDDRYLPPRESLRADVLLNAMRRVEPQDFNIDSSSSPSKSPQTTGLIQILDVLKQDIVLDEHGTEVVPHATMRPALEPSLRRSTLQQLAVIMRQQELHDTFMQCDGLRATVAILRMSLMVDDYLAFPECAISCVSVLNSVCFASRHSLAKIPDLLSLLIRVILVFPANDSAVLMAAQVLALVAWAGFALQELDSTRHRVPALPLSVTERASLPFNVNSYWTTSPNAEHSYIEWLLGEEEWRATILVRWWCANAGRARVLWDSPPPPAPLALQPCARDLAALRAASPLYCCSKALLALENATAHAQVNDALNVLEGYIHLVASSSIGSEELGALPWRHTRRFLCAPPASSRDTTLLVAMLHFVLAYMDNVPGEGATMTWIKSAFIGNDASILSLLSRDQLYPQQTQQEDIDVTQLQIHIVKVLLRCIVTLEHDDYDSNKMESLLKILMACLERVDLKNFHMLGYLNELMRCLRYGLNSRHCKLSEDTLIQCLKLTIATLTGCASGGGRKGQACRLDAMVSLLALLRQIHEELVPVQRWSEAWGSEAVRAVVECSRGASAALRAAALHVLAALAHYAQLLPHLLQAVQEDSLSRYASRIFSRCGEANVVRAAAAAFLAAVASRVSSRTNVLETDVLEQLKENNFVDSCLDILVDFCDEKEYKQNFEPNVSISVLERRAELEVRAQKCGDVRISPLVPHRGRPPPTAALLVSVADVLHNVSAFAHFPVPEWNDRGLYRLLFRCVSVSRGTTTEVHSVRAAACRTLVSASAHKCVRTLLAGTKDCLHNLLMTLTPMREDDDTDCLSARTQSLLLLAALLPESSAADSIWSKLKESRSGALFHLLHQCLSSDEIELQKAGLYCLTQLVQSAENKKHADKTKDESCMQYYDNLKTPFENLNGGEFFCAGDIGHNLDCQPEYMAEELCKALINLYKKLSLETQMYHASQDERWIGVCSCLASVLAGSARARLYAAHRRLPRLLLDALQALRDHLSMQGKPADVIRNANNNPVLYTLYWLLTIIECTMVECPPVKETFAEDNIAVSLNRLWPWCMMTDRLRQAVMHLLYTFTNDCPRAWSSMCACVNGRSLIAETCAVAAREAALQSRARADSLLLLALNTLHHCLDHHHCRAVIVKSEALTAMYKMCVRERVRGVCGASAVWARVLEALARRADGAAAVLALAAPRTALQLLPPPLRARLMPAVAHTAHHHRAAFLQSPDLLELLTGTLLAGDTAEIVSAARAVWALAANNHKAKLLLRSAGVASAVQSTLQRLQRGLTEPASQRALQLLTYTNTVLQTT